MFGRSATPIVARIALCIRSEVDAGRIRIKFFWGPCQRHSRIVCRFTTYRDPQWSTCLQHEMGRLLTCSLPLYSFLFFVASMCFAAGHLAPFLDRLDQAFLKFSPAPPFPNDQTLLPPSSPLALINPATNSCNLTTPPAGNASSPCVQNLENLPSPCHVTLRDDPFNT